MATQKIKIGTVLIAINKCHIQGSTWISEDYKDTLTIGKEYTVEYVDYRLNELRIINDNSHCHYFTLNTLSTYFTIKNLFSFGEIEIEIDCDNNTEYYAIIRRKSYRHAIGFILNDNTIKFISQKALTKPQIEFILSHIPKE